ncbi:MAG: LuxR family transcriptional regulator [Rhizomicrobium sp.]|jgi:DNA-binding CsgD family transcriptional regulator
MHSVANATQKNWCRVAEIGIAAFEYIERIQTIHDPLQIREVFAGTLTMLGITNFTLLEFTPDAETIERHIIDNRMPEEWSRRYVEQRYVEVDPVISEVMMNTEPFLWSEALTKCHAGKRQRQIFDEATEFHLNEGICIPIFGPRGYMAWVTLAGSHLDLSPGARAAVHMMALYTHNRLVKLVRSSESPPVTLTRREVDCLRWVAQGKSDWEIGEILNISESTAHWYIENAKRKIGVATRMQAVVGAIAEGVIHV